MSLSNYATLVSTGKATFMAIPVFPPRVFRHGYFFINTDKGIKTPADLKGKRGGVPEYTMTAAVYMRGLLQHESGVRRVAIEWMGGRASRLNRKLPPDIRLTQAPAGTELGDLLERGEIDFMMTANNPLAFRRGSPKVRRLFPNYAEVEKDYYRRTKIYPIMHTVVVRRDVHEANPWVALSMYKALCRAKEHAYQLLADMGSPKVSSAWLQPLIEEEKEIIGQDWYPYGIEPNRTPRWSTRRSSSLMPRFSSIRTRPPPSGSSGSSPRRTPSTRSKARSSARSSASSASRVAPRHSRPSASVCSCARAPRRCRTSWA